MIQTIGKQLKLFLKNMKNNENFNVNNFALMQGRLVDSEKKNEIQFFPKKIGKKNQSFLRKIILNILNGSQVMKTWKRIQSIKKIKYCL